jgi:hypothetical protein
MFGGRERELNSNKQICASNGGSPGGPVIQTHFDYTTNNLTDAELFRFLCQLGKQAIYMAVMLPIVQGAVENCQVVTDVCIPMACSFGLALFIEWVLVAWLPPVIRRAVENTIHKIPGLCYLCLFRYEHKLEAIMKHGLYPMSADVVTHSEKFDDRRHYSAIRVDGSVHITIDPLGVPLDRLLSNLPDVPIGGTSIAMPTFNNICLVQQTMRMLTVTSMLCALLHQQWIAVAFATFISYNANEYISSFVAFTCALMLLMNISTAILMAVIYLISSYLLRTYLVGICRGAMYKPKYKAPSNHNYPEGIGPSTVVYTYTGHDKGKFIGESRPMIDDSLNPEEREVVIAKLRTDPVNRKTGNPHAMPAQTAMMARRIIHTDGVSDRILVNVGGTSQGWPKEIVGVGFQPELASSDSYHLSKFSSPMDSAFAVVPEPIDTRCRPVGSTEEVFSPSLNVKGIGGANIAMVHVYDVPIKALLAFAEQINSERVSVAMHMCPDVFTKTSGKLPWTNQLFRHLNDGTTEWTWNNTTADTFNHSTRVMHEHVWTHYVQTVPGSYWVSCATRDVGDMYIINWTRQSTPPARSVSRTLVTEHPRTYVDVPLIKSSDSGKYEISYTEGVKVIEEYIHEANSLSDLQICLRSMVEQLERSRGVRINYFPTHIVTQLWEAELYRKKLVEAMGLQKDNNTTPMQSIMRDFKRLVGFAPDIGSLSEIAKELHQLLTVQPSSTVTLPLMNQTKPYMKPISEEKRMKVELKVMTMPTVNDSSNFILPPTYFDNEYVKILVELKGTGQTVSEQFLSAIYGTTNPPGAILPLGVAPKGGSALTEKGTRLTKTEIMYLHMIDNVMFMSKVNGLVKFYGGPMETKRVPLILIDTDSKRCVRVHYNDRDRATEGLQKVLNHYNAVYSSLNDDEINKWYNIFESGSQRTYRQHPNYTELYRQEVAKPIMAELSNERRRNPANEATIQQLTNELEQAAELEPPELGFNGNEKSLNALQFVDQNKNYKVYDAGNLEKLMLPPAHLYYDGTLLEMMNLIIQIPEL